MEIPIVKRVTSVKCAALFHRIDPDPTKIREDYMKSKADSGKDMFSDSFSLTQNPGNRPVENEFKREVAFFMMAALRAMDAYGFIPWKVSYIQSQDFPDRVIKVIRVPKFGLWRVRQLVLPGDSMEVVYQLQHFSNTSSSTNTGLLADPSKYDEDEIKQVGDAMLQTMTKSSSGSAAAAAPRVALPGMSNSARDYESLLIGGRKDRGIYIINEPSAEGWPISPAMSAAPINQRMNRLWECNAEATSISSNPMLITGNPTADKQPAINAATSWFKRGDMSRMRAQKEEETNARLRALVASHDSAVASMAEDSKKFHFFYDNLTGQKMCMETKPFYADHHYPLTPGDQVFSQPPAKEPERIEEKQQTVDDQTAALFGVTYSVAFLGDQGKVSGSAEYNQQVLDNVVSMQGNRIAKATEWILNHVFHEDDTDTYVKELEAQKQLISALEQEEDNSDDDDGAAAASPSPNQRRSKLDIERERASFIEKIIQTQNRYRVTFSDKAPPIDSIAKLVERGLVDRNTEAALMASSLGVSPALVQVQSGPSAFDKATLKAASDAKAKPSSTGGGGAKRSSASSASKKKKPKSGSK
jgi:hypothetical protein